LGKDQLLEDRKRLQQKLHLGQLRLKARDAEIEYLHHLKQPQHFSHQRPSDETNLSHQSSSPQPTNASPRFKKDDAHNKTRRYLFQQQYSPKLRSEIRPTSISGLDSLGILADQMLSDPDFESQHADTTERPIYTSTPPPSTSTYRKPKLRKRPLNNVNDDEPDPTIYYYNRPAYSSSNAPTYHDNEKRSKRSIDSAKTLLSIFPSKSPTSQPPIQGI
jgi:hypothetical protein